jgi:hypothetical protein
MTRMNPLMASSLRMAIEGTSSAVGRPPAWFERAVDIRFVDYALDKGDTLLVLELPTLGDAAEELYRQTEFWDTKPSPNQTACEVFSRVVREVSQEAGESGWFDAALLRRFATMQRVFGSGELCAIRLPSADPSAITPSVVQAAAKLVTATPPPRQVRIVGKLDMIRHSTRGFGLTIDSGEEVQGVLKRDELLQDVQELFGRRVLVLGQAVYRPSGRLLRVDAVGIEPGEGAPPLWSKIPAAQSKRPLMERLRPAEVGRQGVAAFFGTWPGDESDADMAEFLERVRA